jgi:hypothetical protein
VRILHIRLLLLLAAPRRERGQATTEYVLVLLGVAAIAIAVATWAASSGRIGALLDRVFDDIDTQIT